MIYLLILKNINFFKIGLGILAKFENSLTNFSISLICLLIVSKYFSKSFLSLLIYFYIFLLNYQLIIELVLKDF